MDRKAASDAIARWIDPTGLVLHRRRDDVDDLAAKIADRFAGVLGSWLSPEQLAEVRRRNANPAYEGCCASHDFCDANMAMEQAFHDVRGCGRCHGSEADAALWNAAWDIALDRHLRETPR